MCYSFCFTLLHYIVARSVVETCKKDIQENLESLVVARTTVTEEQEKLKEKKKESNELAQEAGILASKAHSAEELIEANKADEDTQMAMEEVQQLSESLEAAKTHLGTVRDTIAELGVSLKKCELESRDLEKKQSELIAQLAIQDQKEIRRRRSPNANAAPWLQTLFIQTNGGKTSFACSRYPCPPSVPPRPQVTDQEMLPKSLSLMWNMALWDGAVIDEYETQCRGQSRADREWRTVRNCPLLPADRHYSVFLNNRIERRVSTGAAGLSPATSVQFRVRCHTAGGWSPFSQCSEFGWTSRSDWFGRAVTPRIPRRLDDEFIAAGRSKGGIFQILQMMRGNIDKIELQIKGLSVLSGHVTLATSSMFTVSGGGSGGNPRAERSRMLQRAKRDSKGVRINHAKAHSKAIFDANAIEIVCASMKLHKNSAPIQIAGMRLFGFWAATSDDVRRRIVLAGGLDICLLNTKKIDTTLALWSVNLLQCKLSGDDAAKLVQNKFRQLTARRELKRRVLEKKKKEEQETREENEGNNTAGEENELINVA